MTDHFNAKMPQNENEKQMATELKLNNNEIPKFTKVGHTGEINLATISKGVGKRPLQTEVSELLTQEVARGWGKHYVLCNESPRACTKISSLLKCKR